MGSRISVLVLVTMLVTPFAVQAQFFSMNEGYPNAARTIVQMQTKYAAETKGTITTPGTWNCVKIKTILTYTANGTETQLADKETANPGTDFHHVLPPMSIPQTGCTLKVKADWTKAGMQPESTSLTLLYNITYDNANEKYVFTLVN